jgi:hypothetical protein
VTSPPKTQPASDAIVIHFTPVPHAPSVGYRTQGQKNLKKDQFGRAMSDQNMAERLPRASQAQFGRTS